MSDNFCDKFASLEYARRVDELIFQFIEENKRDYRGDLDIYGLLQGLADTDIEELIFMREKRVRTATILSVCLGLFGVDSFYLGDKSRGILKLCTLGGLGILWIYDIFHVGARTRHKNERMLREKLASFRR